MRQLEIGLLIGPPIAWKPEVGRYDGEHFTGAFVMWLFVAVMIRIYAEDAPSGAKAGRQ